MHAEEYILAKDTEFNINKIEIPVFKKEELELIEGYVEFTRHFQEINQLFHIFKVNLEIMLANYSLKVNDVITRKKDFLFEENDGIVINALVINYISSAITFVESIETFIKYLLGEDNLEEFKEKTLSKIYDEKFSYRLLKHLRNYSQHGHLPVSIDINNRCYFELEHILNTPHFTHNKKLKDEMESIKKAVLEEFDDNARIMFTRTLAEYEILILEVYKDFIEFIFDKLSFYKKEIDLLIIENPKIIYNSKDELNGFVIYKIEDNNVHCFDPKDNPQEMIKQIKQEVLEGLNIKKEQFKKIFSLKVSKEIPYSIKAQDNH